MSLHERIKEARKRKGLTQTELGLIIGVAKTTIAGYEKLYEPSASQLGAIADALDVDVTFLLQDEIKQRKEVYASLDEMEHLVKKYRALDEHGKEMVDVVLEKELERVEVERRARDAAIFMENQEPKVIRPRMTDRLVYTNPAAAGTPLYAESDFERMELPEDDVPYNADFGIRISGRSMEPTVMDGSIAWVHKTSEVDDGDVAIFIINDSAVCKRFYKNDDGSVRLESDNPEFGPVRVTEFDNFVLVGEVVGTV